MTKKTNSLIFRFGLSVLWDNKNIKNKNLRVRFQLENIIVKELKKWNLSVLKVVYCFFLVNIFSYNNVKVDNKFKSQILLYYKKVLDLQKVIEKFGLNKKMVVWLLKRKNIFKINQKLSSVSFMLLNLYMCKVFFFTFYLFLLSCLRFFFYNFFCFVFTYLNLWINVFNKTILNRDLINVSLSKNNLNSKLKKQGYYKKKLRKSFGLLNLKLFKISIENIIMRVCGYFVDIFITNIFLKKGSILKTRLGKTFFDRQEFRYVFYILLLSTQYNQSKIITDYVALKIKQTKSHRKILRDFVGLAEFFFFKNFIHMLGFLLRVTGKLNGKMRKSKYHFNLGKVCQQTLNIGLSYNLSLSYTKFGIISIKVWLFHENKFI